MKDGNIIVIGIAGGTGSGKTTITRKIMQHFGGNVSVIYHDNYYKAHHRMSFEQPTRAPRRTPASPMSRAQSSTTTTPTRSTQSFSLRISKSCAAARRSIARPTTTRSTTARKRQ